MKRPLALLLVVVAILFFVTILVATWKMDAVRGVISNILTSQPPTVTSNLTIRELEAMGDLVVLKVHSVDVLQGEGGHYRGSWIVSGDALVAVDMREAKLVSKQDNRATVLLPAPKILSARVNHERTKTYDVERATWIAVIAGDPNLIRDHAMQQAQRLIEHAARRDHVLADAKKNAAMQLQSIYSKVGWEIDVAWEDEPDA